MTPEERFEILMDAVEMAMAASGRTEWKGVNYYIPADPEVSHNGEGAVFLRAGVKECTREEYWRWIYNQVQGAK